jgi:hypothetical protein
MVETDRNGVRSGWTEDELQKQDDIKGEKQKGVREGDTGRGADTGKSILTGTGKQETHKQAAWLMNREQQSKQ